MIDPTIVPTGWEFDLTGYTMAEKFQFNKIGEEASVPFLIRVIRKWPYEGLDPQKAEDYGKLSQLQFDEAVDNFFRSVNAREFNHNLEAELIRVYEDRPGAMYPEVVGPINDLTIAHEFHWTLDYVRHMPVSDYGNALAFVSGMNKGKMSSDGVTVVND